jgi:hydrogenase small subunit
MHTDVSQPDLEEYLSRKGVSRRRFLQFCGMMTAALALPLEYSQVIANALAGGPRLPLVWLEFQDCTGDTESFLRASPRADPAQNSLNDPGIVDLLLDYLSLDYHETLMAPAGAAAQLSLNNTLSKYAGQFICVVEGSIPMGAKASYCMIRGRTAQSILQDVSSKAMATIALGSCAYDGGLAGAVPNPTGAGGVKDAAPSVPNLINLPGCPSNVVNLVACLVNYLAFKAWPALDSARRPRFAYGQSIHENCERHDHYEREEYVHAWGDAGHRQGWCLYLMGCKGPVTHSNCNIVRWNAGTNWPVGAGHGCIGCARDKFWDQTSAYIPVGD